MGSLMLVDRSAHQLAEAVGLVLRGVLQGIVALLLAKGTAAAAGRVPEVVGKLRESRLGAGFAQWIESNWARLIEEPKLKGEPAVPKAVPAKDTGPAVTPSQLRRMAEQGKADSQAGPRGKSGEVGSTETAGLGGAPQIGVIGDAVPTLGPGWRVTSPRGLGAATGPVPNGYVPVSRWVSPNLS